MELGSSHPTGGVPQVSPDYPADFHRSLAGGARRSAEVIVPLVQRLVAAESVVDVGCGVGSWLSVFRECGARRILGIDAGLDADELVIPVDQFLNRDVSEPLRLSETFDLAISLEVAEHLPATNADTLVSSLVQLAPAVLFSAAIPFQGGYNHLNEQWPEYWVERFQRHGLAVIDAIRKEIWLDERVEWWYAQNTLLFATREALEHHPSLRFELDRTEPRRLALVHPRNYARCWS
ncbi:MAG: methyltransferase domain-containing protein [Chloroflexi bacterium]|nr:methyltransferase domain-containing protein [Chloroflexota bacterium]MBV9547966.1 methyltransferase domain-containing protein [Chloroflexota bacterium]